MGLSSKSKKVDDERHEVLNFFCGFDYEDHDLYKSCFFLYNLSFSLDSERKKVYDERNNVYTKCLSESNEQHFVYTKCLSESNESLFVYTKSLSESNESHFVYTKSVS